MDTFNDRHNPAPLTMHIRSAKKEEKRVTMHRMNLRLKGQNAHIHMVFSFEGATEIKEERENGNQI